MRGWLAFGAALLLACTASPPTDTAPALSINGTAVTASQSPIAASAAPSATPRTALIDSITLGTDIGSAAVAIAFAPQRRWLYVRTERGVVLIDAATDKIVRRLDLPGSSSTPGGIAVDESRYVYASSRDGTLTAILLDLSAIAGTVPVGGEPGPVAFDPRTHFVYALDVGVAPIRIRETTRPGAVLVVNPNGFSLEATIPAPGFPFSIAASGATGRVYVSGLGTDGSGFVQVVSGDTFREIGVIGTTPGVSLVLDERMSILYMVSPGAPGVGQAGTITYIDGRTNLASTFVNPANPDALGLDPVRGHLYLVDLDGHLTIATIRVDVPNPGVYSDSRLQLPIRPTGIVADPLRHRVYVAHSSGVVSVISDDWP